MVGAADRQQRSYSGWPGAVVGVRRVVAPLRVLEHLAQRVDAEAVDAAVEPEAQDAEHRLAQLRVAPVQVGLLAQVGVVVELPALGVERPRRPAEHAEPVVARAGRSRGTSPGARGTTGARPTCGWGRSRAAAAGRARARRRPARRSPRACRTAARSPCGRRCRSRSPSSASGRSATARRRRRRATRRWSSRPAMPRRSPIAVAVGVGERARIDVVDDAVAATSSCAQLQPAGARATGARRRRARARARAAYAARASSSRPSRRSSSPRVACR